MDKKIKKEYIKMLGKTIIILIVLILIPSKYLNDYFNIEDITN